MKPRSHQNKNRFTTKTQLVLNGIPKIILSVQFKVNSTSMDSSKQMTASYDTVKALCRQKFQVGICNIGYALKYSLNSLKYKWSGVDY